MTGGWRSHHYHVDPTTTTQHNSHHLLLHNSSALPQVHELFKWLSYFEGKNMCHILRRILRMSSKDMVFKQWDPSVFNTQLCIKCLEIVSKYHLNYPCSLVCSMLGWQLLDTFEASCLLTFSSYEWQEFMLLLHTSAFFNIIVFGGQCLIMRRPVME